MKQLIRLFTNHCRALLLVSAVLAPLSSASAQEKLLVTGTGSAIGVMNLIAKAFEKTTPGVKVEVLPSVGSTGGIKAVKDGKIDVGISSRQMKPEERSQDLM
jgi:phosphate transport system substrate-binding protein